MVSTAGAGDSNDQANWHKAYAENNLPRHYDWLGNDHDTRQFQKCYTPTAQASLYG